MQLHKIPVCSGALYQKTKNYAKISKCSSFEGQKKKNT